MSVSIEGPEAVFLEERLVGEEGFNHGWRLVCVMPCRAVVTSSPCADHRSVDGTSSRGIVIREAEGASRVVRYERASAASTPLIVGGIVLGVGGTALSVAGVVQALSDVTIRGCGGDRYCESEKKKNRAADQQERTPHGRLSASELR